ncbi:ABC transporter ATP-binding protein [Hoeflea alexandrii]|uniref:ABC transporter ATP-binding protein n=1 Tax=Hoeflea alexandrii TaxID=288436 RepID=UPI0022AF2BCD|nr:ATP-binding cassette domain-containing protein [Hoeflea alexandrii]MCZ4291914.1 ATP-binding cassette domain-containing protein [Hoeflea alexandrii]
MNETNMNRGAAPATGARIRELALKGQTDSALYNAQLEQLLKVNNAKRTLSTYEHGSQHWLDRAEVEGDGSATLLEQGGFHMVAMSRETVKLNWQGAVDRSGSVAMHMLIDLSSNIDHNLYISMDGTKQRSLRVSNKSLTWVETASVIHLENKLVFITLVRSPTRVSIYVNGTLKLRKKIDGELKSDRLEINLLGDESADLGALIHGLEVWSLDGEFTGLEHAASGTLQDELNGIIDSGDLTEVCDFLATFDDVDLAPLSDKLIVLLDKSLTVNKGFPDWGVDQILSALPAETAAAWRKRHVDDLPVPSVKVEGVTIRLFKNPAKKWAPQNLLRFRKAPTFDAVSRVSFNVYPGDILGIIGANGAGKSTLLKAINGLVPIQEGAISLYAKPLLLSPGLGIRDELSGSENIRLACCFMGMSTKEADALYQSIVEFSELGEFINQPYKFYSDGMKSRLVFSIATAVAPDIIMLDELLNAGDIGFQQKAARRMEETIDRAKAVIIVTHSVPFVLNRCNKALLLHHGQQMVYGSPHAAVARYLDILRIGDLSKTTEFVAATG